MKAKHYIYTMQMRLFMPVYSKVLIRAKPKTRKAKKEYYGYAQDNMNREITWYLEAFERFNRDTARAARIEADANRVIAELRDDKHIQQALRSIAKQWHHARITKSQRALLGKNAMKQISLIYKTL